MSEMKPISLYGLFLSVVCIVLSCAQNKEQPSTKPITRRPLTPPRVTLLASLPDSSKPVITYLKDYPAPKTIRVTKPPQVHSFVDPLTNTPLPPETQGLGFFTNFTTDQGLVSDYINCMLEDKWGNLWFGGSGLSRYDGKSFTNYTAKQGLALGNVWCMAADKTGALWF
ncbi:MAG: hypothetical protein LH609_15900, partial [Rudanella sp.]|nr:hypothetical protein [Rudanella sp.]